mgnify:CR=1 FL=1
MKQSNYTISMGLFGKQSSVLRFAPSVKVFIATSSMEPTICVGEKVLIQRFPSGHVRAGDIIAFFYAHKIIVHRVLKLVTTGGCRAFQTKGDNVSKPDKRLVTAKNYIGLVERESLFNHLYHFFFGKMIDKFLSVLRSFRNIYVILFGEKCGKLFKRHWGI